MSSVFALIHSRGPAWNRDAPIEAQAQWVEHAAFMDALFEEGFIALGGPFEGTDDVLLIFRASSEAEIRHLLTDGRVYPWTLRLGSVER